MDDNTNNQTAQAPTTAPAPATETPATPPTKKGMNKMMIIVGVLVVIILGLVGYLLFANKSSVSTSSNTPTPSTAMTTSTAPSPSATTTSGMLIYVSSDKKWQIMYPKDATAEKREATQIGPAGIGEVGIFYKAGPTQSTGTEFHDGYSVTVGTMKKPAGTTLEKFADDQISTNPEIQVTKTPYQKITINGLSGVTNVVSSMATFKFVYLAAPNDNELVYYVAILAEGADKLNYEKITNDMLQSFKLL